MNTKQHYDDPLQELIDAAAAVLAGPDKKMLGHYTEIRWSLLNDLDKALDPFRPVPEDNNAPTTEETETPGTKARQ